ncbi:uncharacterized protein LOC125771242 isoform X2 [Anopheles funestus]|uniref:uncharacterized protein LOC125771242 isoform X2 n=1 Tax=Anopheles funestus TaxID=62324 RepID=UPI0020C6DB68|nr:uncharacterized protein LOC125771242 isoform X2 [Anopheles funestus]
MRLIFQFPVSQFTKQFRENPCHFIDARFIVLVTRSCFLKDRSIIVQFFDDQGIVNYAIVPMPSSAYDRVDNMRIYTENRFSKEEIYVQLEDLDNMHRLFPNKLINLYGYHIRVGIKGDDFPYVTISNDLKAFPGILNIMFEDLGKNILNLTYTIFQQKSERYDADVYFDIAFHRKHFQHEFIFRDMSGMCLFCPVKYTRYFFSHLLKPFSLGAWIFLGGVLVVCCVLQLIFPYVFRYDPILQTIFGVVGNGYYQGFPARVVLLTLSLLSFFFSRTYTSKILALMSLGSFSKRPKTIAEFIQSDYMMAIHKEDLAQFPLDDFIPKMLDLLEFEQLTWESANLYHYYYCSLEPCGDA